MRQVEEIKGIAKICNFCDQKMGSLDVLRSYICTHTCPRCRRTLYVFLSDIKNRRLLVWRGENETNGEFIDRAREMAGGYASLYPALNPDAASGQ